MGLGGVVGWVVPKLSGTECYHLRLHSRNCSSSGVTEACSGLATLLPSEEYVLIFEIAIKCALRKYFMDDCEMNGIAILFRK